MFLSVLADMCTCYLYMCFLIFIYVCCAISIKYDDDDDDDMLLQESMVSSPTCTRKQAEAGYRTEPKKT